MKKKKIPIKELQDLLKTTLEKFYSSEDNKLLLLNGVERTCVFRIGLYLHDEIKVKIEEENKDKSKEIPQKETKIFSSIELDSEYNKHFENPKVDNKGRLIRPDLIMHSRFNDDNNVMAIEFKGYWNKKGIERDTEKLKTFTEKEKGYKYQLGVLVVLEKEYADMICFRNGKISKVIKKVRAKNNCFEVT